jgi:hypothetical protein
MRSERFLALRSLSLAEQIAQRRSSAAPNFSPQLRQRLAFNQRLFKSRCQRLLFFRPVRGFTSGLSRCSIGLVKARARQEEDKW